MVTKWTGPTALSVFVSLLVADEIADMQLDSICDIRCHGLKSMVTKWSEPTALSVFVSLLVDDEIPDMQFRFYFVILDAMD